MPNQKRFLPAIALMLLFLAATPALGWGKTGHEIIAEIAARYLTPTSRNKVSRILQGQDLAAIATWADLVRQARPETRYWHFVDIPLSSTTYDETRDCVNGRCGIAAVLQFKAVLQNRDSSLGEKGEAIKFLVHLIGDMHQPLHCATNDDWGGNLIRVQFFGKPTNIHAIWDVDLIERDLDDSDLNRFVERLITKIPADIKPLQEGTVVDWVLESHKLAETNAYVLPNTRVLDVEYYDSNIPIIESQLIKAGLRLAQTLNEAFEKQ